MDGLVTAFNTVKEGSIDFEGQRLAERITQWGLIVSAALGYLIGFSTSSILYAFYAFALGSLLVLLVVVPPWPMYNKHEVKWLPVRVEEEVDARSGKKQD